MRISWPVNLTDQVKKENCNSQDCNKTIMYSMLFSSKNQIIFQRYIEHPPFIGIKCAAVDFEMELLHFLDLFGK